MKKKLSALSHRYLAALGDHLKKRGGFLEPALPLGRRAAALGLKTLDLARVHEQALAGLGIASGQGGQVKQAENFFAEAITPIIETHRAARQSKIQLNRLNGTLSRRTAELAAASRKLRRGIVRRKKVESALEKSGQQYAKLLRESLQLQKGLRQLTHQVLAAQEEERRKMSLGLRDEIAQTLLGINVRLLSLKEEAGKSTKGLRDEIASTQRLVAESAQTVRQFAREAKKA